MPSEKNLVTKARLSEVKTAESELVDNLYAHANASLSKAHGMILWNLPHPTYDGGGNDISFYQDSHGDRVGYYFLRLTYNNTNYFAPLELSMLPGKDPLTGISPDTNVVGITPVIPGGTAWVTDFTPEDEQDLIVTNNQLLLPHTLLSHWETHTGGVYQVIPQTVTDSSGHRVANYVARVVVDGVELRLPCDPRLGGPVQPMRVAFPAITTINGSNANYCEMGRDSRQFGYFWYNPPTGGTLPYSFVWELNTYQTVKTNKKFYNDPLTGSGSWVTLTPSAQDYIPQSVYFFGNPVSENAYYQYVGNKLVLSVKTGSDSKKCAATVRGRYTNAFGQHTYTNWCMFVCNDEDGSGFISDPDFNQSASKVTIKNDPVWIDGYYTPPGPPP